MSGTVPKFRWTSLSFAVLGLAGLAALIQGGCPPSGLNPSIVATQTPNQIGGTITVNGTGFTPSNSVQIKAMGIPGRTTARALNFANTDAFGAFPNTLADFGYQLNCDFGLPNINITIIATDNVTGAFAAATVSVNDCGWQ